MIRKFVFWLHLSIGVTTGVFIFIMASTGVALSFERQIIDFLDRGIRSVSVPQDAQQRGVNGLLEAVRRSGIGEPTAIVLRNQPQAAMQFLIGRNKTVYVDPYSGAVLGVSSPRARGFFFSVERLHRALGTSLGSKTVGHWATAISNLLFGFLILLGVILWVPRRRSWKAARASIAFRTGLYGRAREWSWHNVLGIWCAFPLLVIVLTGVVMSFGWANALLFRLAGSTPAASSHQGGEMHSHARYSRAAAEPNYLYLFMTVKTLNPDWRTITLNILPDANAPVSAQIDTGTGGQPQRRTQYLLNPNTGTALKTSTFADSSLGQRLRAFVRFGHTGEYYGLVGQMIAAIASLGACVLVYTGLSLSIRRLAAKLKAKRRDIPSARKARAEQSVV